MTQRPGDFVVDGTGPIPLAHHGRDVGDDAPVAALLAAVDQMKAGS